MATGNSIFLVLSFSRPCGKVTGRDWRFVISTQRDIFDLHAEFCGLFSNAARLRLLWALGEEESTVTHLAKKVGLSVSTTSRHLSKLKDKGVVESCRKGSNTCYTVTNQHFIAGCKEIREGILDVILRNGELMKNMKDAD